MYLYLINKPSSEGAAAELECLMLTGTRTNKNYALGSKFVDLNHSAYIDTCIDILASADSLQALYEKIDTLKLDFDKFRVNFINTYTHIDFKTRKDIERKVSDIFPTDPDLKNPSILYAVSIMEDSCIFGKIISKTQNRWLNYSEKPHSFSSSLPSRVSRALVNAVCQGNKNLTLVDPCCGMGTVLLEALDMGIDAYGYDINRLVAYKANKNLAHFGFENRVKWLDAAEIEGNFDASIIDLPYGILSKKGTDKYFEIISNMRKVCRRSIIVSGSDIRDIITRSGFEMRELFIMKKGGLSRHIYVCG